jgi:hypothetical protein
MEKLEENNLVKFKNISKKKGIMFANFQAKCIRGGITMTASISVDISSIELHPTDPLEKIIEQSAHIAIREFKKANFKLEDFTVLSQEYLGVAQLG